MTLAEADQLLGKEMIRAVVDEKSLGQIGLSNQIVSKILATKRWPYRLFRPSKLDYKIRELDLESWCGMRVLNLGIFL